MLNIGAHDTVFRGNSAELTDQAWRSFVIHHRIFSSRLLPIFCSLLTIEKIFYREKSRFYLAVINTSPPHTPSPPPPTRFLEEFQSTYVSNVQTRNFYPGRWYTWRGPYFVAFFLRNFTFEFITAICTFI
jgi:hypothetical protein